MTTYVIGLGEDSGAFTLVGGEAILCQSQDDAAWTQEFDQLEKQSQSHLNM